MEHEYVSVCFDMSNGCGIYGYRVFYLSEKWYGRDRLSRFVVYKHNKLWIIYTYTCTYIKIIKLNIYVCTCVYVQFGTQNRDLRTIWKCEFMRLKMIYN